MAFHPANLGRLPLEGHQNLNDKNFARAFV